MVDGSLAEDRGSPSYQRRVDDIAVAHDPADVRCAPEDVVVLNVPKGLEVVIGAHHVATVDVEHALGCAGGAAGVEDIQRVLGIHLLGRAVDAAFSHQLVEVDISGSRVLRRPLPAPDHHVFNQVHALDGLVADPLQVDLVAPPVADIGGDDHLGLGV